MKAKTDPAALDQVPNHLIGVQPIIGPRGEDHSPWTFRLMPPNFSTLRLFRVEAHPLRGTGPYRTENVAFGRHLDANDDSLWCHYVTESGSKLPDYVARHLWAAVRQGEAWYWSPYAYSTGHSVVCPDCRTEEDIAVDPRGYPDGYTCDDCGVVALSRIALEGFMR